MIFLIYWEMVTNVLYEEKGDSKIASITSIKIILKK